MIAALAQSTSLLVRFSHMRILHRSNVLPPHAALPERKRSRVVPIGASGVAPRGALMLALLKRRLTARLFRPRLQHGVVSEQAVLALDPECHQIQLAGGPVAVVAERAAG